MEISRISENFLQRCMVRRFLSFCLLSILCCYCSGCMQFSLTAGGNKDEESKNGAVYYGSYYSFWWGKSPEETLLNFMESKKYEKNARPLYQVMYSSNYLYAFVSFISFGFCVPLDVRWYLIAPVPEEYQGPVRKKKN